MPAMLSVAAVLLGSEQEAPLSVIVTVVLFVPEPAPVAVQELKPVPSVIVGVAGTTKAVLKTAVIVSPADSAPLELVVKPAVQVVVALNTCEAPLNVTLETLVAAAIVTAEAGFVATVSVLVWTENVLAA